MGLGDRFGHQGEAQLRAIIAASEKGIEITPVWNKSNREHELIGTKPGDVRTEADTVTKKAGFKKDYFVDADHINLNTVERFINSSDFFTIDVASYIGMRANDQEITEFTDSVKKYTGNLVIPGIDLPFRTTRKNITQIAEKYLFAAIKAFEIYRKIEKKKGRGNFITEISMDEVLHPQSPVELFFILKMFAAENIPVQTIAPKFSGRFNKGIDYDGDPDVFCEEFEAYLMVIDFAIKEFGMPENLKISIHSGSDKFSIYPSIGSVIRKHNKGVHIKTAGTTWLEEVIGLAESGGDALEFVKEIYLESLDMIDELCAPYSDVIDIKISDLPLKTDVIKWTGKKFAASIRHDKECEDYNSDMRQMMHISYKLAANRMEQFHKLLDSHKLIIGECVFENIYSRHISRLFETE